MISTRGRYALRVLIDIAEHQKDGYVPMKDVAARQNLSLKYLEQITPILKQHGMVEGIHGRGGGYRLTKTPDKYIVGDILKVTERDMAPVGCLAEGAKECPLREKCKTLSFWVGLEKVTNDYLNSKTIADLL